MKDFRKANTSIFQWKQWPRYYAGVKYYPEDYKFRISKKFWLRAFKFQLNIVVSLPCTFGSTCNEASNDVDRSKMVPSGNVIYFMVVRALYFSSEKKGYNYRQILEGVIYFLTKEHCPSGFKTANPINKKAIRLFRHCKTWAEEWIATNFGIICDSGE